MARKPERGETRPLPSPRISPEKKTFSSLYFRSENQHQEVLSDSLTRQLDIALDKI